MPVNTTVWPLEPHTKAKHEILTGYLQAWFPILARHQGRVVFLDGFAGPGVYAHGEPGSPVLALRALLDHSYFANMGGCEFVFGFNEVDRDRHDSLVERVEELRASYGGWPKNVAVQTFNESFPDLARALLDGLEGRQIAPTLAFLDPFGYRDVPLALIKELLAFQRCELYIYFDFNSVSRFAQAGNVDTHFEALFGTNEFKSAPPTGDPRRKQFLHDLYERQLRDVAGFDFVRSFEMVNRSGRTGNYMFFCTRNATAFDKMKQTMWKVAPTGDFRFSDRLADQDVLFEANPDFSALETDLRDTFGGAVTSIEQVTDHVVRNTPYCSTHVKTSTLKPMQLRGLVEGVAQRRPGQFPPGTTIRIQSR